MDSVLALWAVFWFGALTGFIAFVCSTANFKSIGWWFYNLHMKDHKRGINYWDRQ